MDKQQKSELGFMRDMLTPTEYAGYCIGCVYREIGFMPGQRSPRILKRAVGYLDAAIDASDLVDLERSKDSIKVEFHETVHRLS